MKTETIGAILREYKQKAGATVPDLLPQLCERAKTLRKQKGVANA